MRYLPSTSYNFHLVSRGFTLIEVLISIGVLLLVSGAGSLYLFGFRSEGSVENATRQLVGVLSAAQEKSASQEDGSRWGVYIDNRTDPGTYTLYEINEDLLALGDETTPGTSTQLIAVSTNVTFASPTIGTIANIIFSKNTGLPIASTTLVLRHKTTTENQETVYISGNGRIDYR